VGQINWNRHSRVVGQLYIAWLTCIASWDIKAEWPSDTAARGCVADWCPQLWTMWSCGTAARDRIAKWFNNLGWHGVSVLTTCGCVPQVV
jgi:hypothetical protein